MSKMAKHLMQNKSRAAAALILLLGVAPAVCADAGDATAQRIDELARQIDALRAQILELKSQNEALANRLEGRQDGQRDDQLAATAAPRVNDVPATGVPSGQPPRASVFGYGELNYNHYDHDHAATQADLRRAVFGLGYRFDENTRFVSEFEFEHAIASSGDQGEAEVEQFYVDHRIWPWASLKAGLFLIPAGYLNESHEPPRYYGVERNFVETAIIPSTWREGGIGLYGRIAAGLRWEAGVTTGFNLAKWDFSAQSQGRESPLGSIHQELQLAKASDLAQYAALNFDGLPGLNLGASLFTGGAGQAQPGIADHPRVTLWEAHTRWTPGRLDLAALYARGVISATGAQNLANAGEPTPIPDAFYGWYVQGAYRAWQRGARSLSPFVRYERFNTASDFAGADPSPTETAKTYGANFYLNPNVVFKADYQDFSADPDKNRFDLGVGLMFY